jgi:hypothetical protein
VFWSCRFNHLQQNSNSQGQEVLLRGHVTEAGLTSRLLRLESCVCVSACVCICVWICVQVCVSGCVCVFVWVNLRYESHPLWSVF